MYIMPMDTGGISFFFCFVDAKLRRKKENTKEI